MGKYLADNISISITKAQARSFLLRYQGLLSPRQVLSDAKIVAFFKQVGCVQYDPLNTVARNADLVLQSRCKEYSEQILYKLLYEKRQLVDGWDKNMSIWAINDWPYFKRIRQRYKKHYSGRAREFALVKKVVRRRLAEHEYVSSSDFENGQKVNWGWGPTNIARAVLESLYHCGELAIHHKTGTRKFYSLSEKLYPESILKKPDPTLSLRDYHEWYAKRRIGSIGLLWDRAGDAWLGSNLISKDRSLAIGRLQKRGSIIEVRIEGLKDAFYLLKQYLPQLGTEDMPREASFIAPLDNLIWDRKLISALFGFEYRWEVYAPASKRRYGYYVLPVLYGDRFVARFEPVLDRKSKTLCIRNWWWEKDLRIDSDMKNALGRCLGDFAAFLDAGAISMADNLDDTNVNWITKSIG